MMTRPEPTFRLLTVAAISAGVFLLAGCGSPDKTTTTTSEQTTTRSAPVSPLTTTTTTQQTSH
jgi:uncharacterized lipoprotein YajG